MFMNGYGALTAEDSIISVAGTINFKEGEVPKLLANRITDIRALGELAADEGADGIRRRWIMERRRRRSERQQTQFKAGGSGR